MKIYFDSVIPIYLLDHAGSFHVRAAARLSVLEAAGDFIAVSELTRLECRVKPLRLGDVISLAKFDAFFARPDARQTPLTRVAFDWATRLRATHNFKLGDALNLGAAIEGGCDVFLTNDNRLDRCKDITVEILA